MVKPLIPGRRVRDIPEYVVWEGMRDRCLDEKAISYPRYGAKGVTICDEWAKNGVFLAFYEHMGPRPSPKHQIDRIDNSKGYEPGNCRWATLLEQARNRVTNVNVTVDGETMCLTDWAKFNGIPAGTAIARHVSGWDPIDAGREPVTGIYEFFGKKMHVEEASKIHGVPRIIISNRIYMGWSPDDAASCPVGMRRTTWKKKFKEGRQ